MLNVLEKMTEQEKNYKKMMRVVWITFAVILPPTLVAEYFIHPHAEFVVDGSRFFYAWFGFASCVVIVVVSKLLGFVLKRKENYYGAEGRDV